MSVYQLQIAEPAEVDFDAAYQYLFLRSPAAAERFRNEVADAIRSLAQMPHRCVLAPESKRFDREVRQLIYRHGRTSYRILFAIFEAEDDNPGFVRILRLRHGAQQPLGESEPED